MNDNGAFLVPYRNTRDSSGRQGLLLLSGGQASSVAFDRSIAPGDRTFRQFSGMQFQNTVAINNAEQVLFAATLDNGRSGIFRREPDGSLVTLAQDSTIALARDTRYLSMNAKGQGAVLLVTPYVNTRQDIFFLGPSGPSKIVGLNDSLPGEGKFLAFASPEINNKGEVVFLGLLSDEKSGLWKTGIFSASRGLETEFVHPVPDLLADATITSDEKQLAGMGRLVNGIAADGAARVVVRVKTGQTGTVEFSLVDENGLLLPPSNFNGFLSEVSEDIGSGSISVPTVDVEGVGPMAFAAYHAPLDFASNPNSPEANDPDRKVSIKITVGTATGETVESTESIKIVRALVVLVHGLWGSEDSWKDFGPLFVKSGDAPPVVDSRFFVERIDYSGTNAAGFVTNSLEVFSQLPDLIRKKYKIEKQVAAVRADVVTHSMGGLLVRMLPTFGGSFFRDDNFGQGDVNRVINIATPHLGSPLA